MEDLISLINYCRNQPQGYYVCGVDYGYGEEYTEAQSFNADKILELWKIKSGWRDMVMDFRQYLINNFSEYGDDDKIMMEAVPEDQVYSIEISITIKSEYELYFQQQGYNFDKDDRYSLTFTISSEGDSIINNTVNIKAIEQDILSAPANYFSHVKIGQQEFYYSRFTPQEELNREIEVALSDD
jgi:hypothetical protein